MSSVLFLIVVLHPDQIVLGQFLIAAMFQCFAHFTPDWTENLYELLYDTLTLSKLMKKKIQSNNPRLQQVKLHKACNFIYAIAFKWKSDPRPPCVIIHNYLSRHGGWVRATLQKKTKI